jgi:hypothetical protein
MTLGYAYSIVPASSGFGLWEASADSELVSKESLTETDYHCYLLGTDELPDGIKDISGLIQNEPDQVYAFISPDGSPTYFGFSSEIRELGNLSVKDLTLSVDSEEMETVLEAIGRSELIYLVTGILTSAPDGEYTEVWVTLDKTPYATDSNYERIL